jgi:hypothetical protein
MTNIMEMIQNQLLISIQINATTISGTCLKIILKKLKPSQPVLVITLPRKKITYFNNKNAVSK